ncbi:hypothetical protein TNCV_289091 [Trichonephila clavipes]|nr:hypothetical protein TNCV_289091 [Trichonephila clavipes]
MQFDMFTHLSPVTFAPSQNGVTTDIPFPYRMSSVSYPKGDRETLVTLADNNAAHPFRDEAYRRSCTKLGHYLHLGMGNENLELERFQNLPQVFWILPELDQIALRSSSTSVERNGYGIAKEFNHNLQ